MRHLDHGREVEVFERGPDRAGQPGRRVSSREVRIQIVELPHFRIGPPKEIAIAGILQIRLRDRLKSMRRIEARGELIGDRLVVDKFTGAGGADGLIVKAHCGKFIAVDASDLGGD